MAIDGTINSGYGFACRGCNSRDSLSLSRHMIDKGLHLQLIDCIRCGHRSRDLWQCHGIAVSSYQPLHGLLPGRDKGKIRQRKDKLVQKRELQIKLQL